MLAVVEDEQRASALERVDQRRRRALGSRLESQGRCRGVGNERRVVEGRKLDEPDAVRVALAELRARLQRQPRLPDTTRPCQGQQRRGRDTLFRIGDLRVPADERR